MRTFLITLTLLSLFAGCSEDPFFIRVFFSETGGLKPGDNVTLHGLSIGQIRDINIAEGRPGVVARVEVEARYQIHLRDGISFKVASEKMVTGKQMLVVIPAPESNTRLKRGALVDGAALEPDPVERVRRALHDTVEQAGMEARGLGRAMLQPDQLPPRVTGGTVDLDQPGRFIITLHSLEVHATQADGSDWDGVGAGAPDLVAQIWVGDRQVLLSPTAEDMLTVQWDAVSEPFHLDSDSEVRVKVLDRDVSFNDEIGVVSFAPTSADVARKRRFRLASGRIKSLELTVSLPPGPAAEEVPSGAAEGRDGTRAEEKSGWMGVKGKAAELKLVD